MNKDDFFEAVKNGVLENLKKTDETLELSPRHVSPTQKAPNRLSGASVFSFLCCIPGIIGAKPCQCLDHGMILENS
ncbi:MAG: hypothetical protein IJM25_01730 [Eubacterium sp.]|nr:hypothetical protein [Eubacterium sp.]